MVLRLIINLLLLGAIIYAVLYVGNLASSHAFNLNLGNLNIKNISHILNSTYIQQNLTYPAIGPQQILVPHNVTIAYVLSLINGDRKQFGLPPVNYSNITSGQQHANSMLQYGYFSHWDTYDMKPYMRYTLLGGLGSVDENVAYQYQSNGVNVINALNSSEYSMMYNDSGCCNNGHRDNIIDANHTSVSIGVAYNKTTVYLVEDFIDNYITWFFKTPSYGNGVVTLKGTVLNGYSIDSVNVNYDSALMNLTPSQAPKTPYTQGTALACVGYTILLTRHYCTQVGTINATTYQLQKQSFNIVFNIQSLIGTNGPGEYTVVMFLNKTGQQGSFIGATYTIFINSAGQPYTPINV